MTFVFCFCGYKFLMLRLMKLKYTSLGFCIIAQKHDLISKKEFIFYYANFSVSEFGFVVPLEVSKRCQILMEFQLQVIVSHSRTLILKEPFLSKQSLEDMGCVGSNILISYRGKKPINEIYLNENRNAGILCWLNSIFCKCYFYIKITQETSKFIPLFI